jgi:hypothetical protein
MPTEMVDAAWDMLALRYGNIGQLGRTPFSPELLTKPAAAETPLGKGSTGRTTPNSLKEKLTMEEVMSNPQNQAIPATSKPMGDPRWPAKDGWVKMRNADNTVHWVQNTKTGAVDDFKFK